MRETVPKPQERSLTEAEASRRHRLAGLGVVTRCGSCGRSIRIVGVPSRRRRWFKRTRDLLCADCEAKS